MIMSLCLLVYTLAQRQMRAALSLSKSTIKNQLGKATERPHIKMDIPMLSIYPPNSFK